MSAIDPKFLLATYPGRQWSLPGGGDLACIQWLDGHAAPATLDSDYLAWENSQASLALQQEAQVALDKSDTTMHRIAEAVALGKNSWTSADVVAWVNYRISLRTIISSSSGTVEALPARPPFPAGA